MKDRQASDLPGSLSKARGRLDQWRSRSRPRARLPEKLWKEAVHLARAHGIAKTARALCLDYYSLKKRLDSASVKELEMGSAAKEFIELLPAGMRNPLPECTIHLEDVDGAKMRIHLKSAELPDLGAITRIFRRDEA